VSGISLRGSGSAVVVVAPGSVVAVVEASRQSEGYSIIVMGAPGPAGGADSVVATGVVNSLLMMLSISDSSASSLATWAAGTPFGFLGALGFRTRFRPSGFAEALFC
jgi:hypothetical protein